jgi:hypothetical protein
MLPLDCLIGLESTVIKQRSNAAPDLSMQVIPEGAGPVKT